MSKSHHLSRRRMIQGGTAAAALGLSDLLVSDQPAVAQVPTPRAKRLLFLFQGGGPSQLEMFDPKPGLANLRGTELPASVLGNKRITTMTAGQDQLSVANSLVGFKQHGASGLWVSDAFPHIASVADDLCMIRSMQSDAVNHDPASNQMLTGFQEAGKPSLGAWVSLGLGNANPALPSFVTIASQTSSQFLQPLPKRLWSSSFIPVRHQGVSLRPGTRPVLYLDDGLGLPETANRQLFEAVRRLNSERANSELDAKVLQRNEAYEIASAMQTSVAEFADQSDEPQEVYDLYGPQARVAGSFAANCIRARRLLQRDVRCVMLMHRGWDHHYTQTEHIHQIAQDVDQPTAGLIQDLKRTGLLEDTLVVWTGEFGRTAYSQGEVTAEDHGRDHHPYAFCAFMAGAGVRAGMTYGTTDDFSFNVVENPVHLHDLHATILHLLGLNHTELTYYHGGRNHRLTDLYGSVVHDVLS